MSIVHAQSVTTGLEIVRALGAGTFGGNVGYADGSVAGTPFGTLVPKDFQGETIAGIFDDTAGDLRVYISGTGKTQSWFSSIQLNGPGISNELLLTSAASSHLDIAPNTVWIWSSFAGAFQNGQNYTAILK